MTLQLLLGLAAGGVLLALAPTLAGQWFRVPSSLVGEAVVSFRLGALSVFLGFLIVVYASVPAALRRFDLLALRTVVLFTVQYALFVAVLHFGGGLREVVMAAVFGSALILVYMVAVARSLLPGIALRPGWNRSAVVELYRFGRHKFVAQSSVTFLREFDRVAIGIMLPVGLVSFYAVPLRLSQRIVQVVEQIASPFYPAITSQLTGGRESELRVQYRIGIRLVATVAFGIIAVLGGLARPLLAVWLGPDFAEAGTWVLRILLVACGVSGFFTLPSVAADGAGRPGIPASFLALGALLHAPLVVLGIRSAGLNGAALGVLAGNLIVLAGVAVIHARIRELPSLREVTAEMRGAFLAGALAAGAGWLLSRSGFPGAGAIPLFVSLLGAGILYLLLLFLFRGVHAGDVRRVVSALRRE